MTHEPTRSTFEQQAESALNAAMKAFGAARVRAGELAHENRSRIDDALTKAGRIVDEKTGGKYHDTVEKVKDQAGKGVDLLANERNAGTTPPAADTWTSPSKPEEGPPMVSPIPPYTPPTSAPGPHPAPSAPESSPRAEPSEPPRE